MAKSIADELLVVGNEILRGEIQDTNTRWICRLINSRGGRVTRATMLSDTEEEIGVQFARESKGGVDLVFVSGSPGPTDGDLTMAAHWEKNDAGHRAL